MMISTSHFTDPISGSELLDLRRDRLRERRVRKASLLTGVVLPTVSAHKAEIIEFPSPEYPRIA